MLLLDRSHARWQTVPSKGFQPSASAATLVSLLDRSRSSACSLPTLSPACPLSRVRARRANLARDAPRLGVVATRAHHAPVAYRSPAFPPGNASLTSRLSVPNLFSSSSPPLLPPPPLHQDDIFTAALKNSSPKRTTLLRHTRRPSLSTTRRPSLSTLERAGR